MLAIERRNEILEKLQAERRVVVSELSQIYDVSEETIRRDLDKLAVEGFAIKSYGGAVINENTNTELPFSIRKKHQVAEKQKIAHLISDMVQDGESVMLDGSSTAIHVAKALKDKDKKNLKIITNSVEIIIDLIDTPGWNVISTGGNVRAGSFALVGPQTDKMLRSYRVNIAVVSCKGMEFGIGFTDSDEQHANNKKTMLESANEKIMAIDSSKFDKSAFTIISKISEVTKVVTDEKPSEKWLKLFEAAGVECIYPQ